MGETFLASAEAQACGAAATLPNVPVRIGKSSRDPAAAMLQNLLGKRGRCDAWGGSWSIGVDIAFRRRCGCRALRADMATKRPGPERDGSAGDQCHRHYAAVDT